MLAIQVRLSDYPDANGLSLPESILLKAEVPLQFADKKEAELIGRIKETVKTATQAITLGNATLTIILQASLN